MSGIFKDLIAENCAPSGVDRIGFYRDGIKEYELHIPEHMKAPTGTKLYSFGAISDIHTFSDNSYTNDITANDDYIRALGFYKNNVDFLCICGDLTCYGTSDLSHYKTLTDQNKGTLSVYAMAGNHEWWGSGITDEIMQEYTGHPIYYSFSHNEDVFIMCGVARNDSTQFTQEELQWLYETLEANRNKRCFLFCHPMIIGYSGDPTSIYPFNMIRDTYGQVFISLLQHYKNTIYFHGHSHILFESQKYTQSNNIPNCIIDKHLGIYSVHIPSLAIPIDITSGYRAVQSEQSQGYVIDVYDNEILLKGKNFIKDKYISTGIYKLNTHITPIEEGTYNDPTGTLNI